MSRPTFKPTKAQREIVAIMAGGGSSQEAIALALGIAKMTLVKYFDHELSVGAHQRRGKVLIAMYKMAIKGNVAAQYRYLQQTPHAAALAICDERLPKVEKRGKKDQANVDAVTAAIGTDWDSILPSGRVQ